MYLIICLNIYLLIIIKIQLVDKVYKLENIKEDWVDICKNLNIDIELEKTEKNSSKFEYNYEDYYNEELKDIVYELYEDDFIISDIKNISKQLL